MAVKKLDKVPNDLKILVAESNGETIVIGNQALLLMPLTVEELESVTTELTKMAEMMFGDDGAPLSISATIQKILSSGAIKTLLGKIIEPLPKSTINNVTIPQLKQIIGVLWRQNLSNQAIGESVRKNFNEMLDWMGIGDNLTSEIPPSLSMTSLPNDMDGQKTTSEEDG